MNMKKLDNCTWISSDKSFTLSAESFFSYCRQSKRILSCSWESTGHVYPTTWSCGASSMSKLATNELSKKLATQQIEASTKVCALIQCILVEK